MILTPSPVNEYQLEKFDHDKNTPHPSRTASLTKLYAEAAKEVGASLGVPVVDLWTAFMTSAGWNEGQPLIGSREVPNLDQFSGLFTDGKHVLFSAVSGILTLYRSAFNPGWLSHCVQRNHGDDPTELAGSRPGSTPICVSWMGRCTEIRLSCRCQIGWSK